MTAGGAFTGLDRWLRGHRWLPDALLAVVLAVILVPTSLPLVLDSTASVSTKVLLTGAIIVAQSTVAFRRSRPLTSYLVCSAAMALVVLTPPLTGLQTAGFVEPLPAVLLPSSGVFLVLLYSIAAEGIGRVPIFALLVAGIGAVAAAVRLLTATIMTTIVPGGWPLPLIVVGALAAAVVAAWTLGRFVRVRKDYVRSLAERARQAEAEKELRAVQAVGRERARIAREMHDVVSHSLAVIVAQAEAGRMAAGKDPALGVAVLPTIASTGRAAMADMRSLLGVLRDPPGETTGEPKERTRGSPERDHAVVLGFSTPQVGGAPAEAVKVPAALPTAPAPPMPGLADIPALVDRLKATGLPVVLQGADNRDKLDPGTELTAYRVVQEGLTNVVKHSRDLTSVVVELIWTAEYLRIRVLDDGFGHTQDIFDGTGTGTGTGGQGLRGMRERVESVGGTLRVGMRKSRGFEVVAQLPVRSDTCTQEFRGSQ